MIKLIFLSHPASVGETYFAHQRHAFGFAWDLALAASACFLHGLVPILFESSGSRTVRDLHERMVVNRVPAGSHDREERDGQA